jgi:hypothetical protein
VDGACGPSRGLRPDLLTRPGGRMKRTRPRSLIAALTAACLALLRPHGGGGSSLRRHQPVNESRLRDRHPVRLDVLGYRPRDRQPGALWLRRAGRGGQRQRRRPVHPDRERAAQLQLHADRVGPGQLRVPRRHRHRQHGHRHLDRLRRGLAAPPPRQPGRHHVQLHRDCLQQRRRVRRLGCGTGHYRVVRRGRGQPGQFRGRALRGHDQQPGAHAERGRHPGGA